MSTFRGEVQITLDGIDLDLQYHTKNLVVLSKITNQDLATFFSRLQGLNVDEGAGAMKVLCDFSFVLPILVAGLAKHPKFGKVGTDKLEERICDLLDQESEKSGQNLMTLVAEVGSKILPAVLHGAGLIDLDNIETEDEGGPKNAPKKSKRKKGDSPGDA